MANLKYARLGYGISLSSDELIPSEYLALGEPWDEELILRVMGMPPKESGLEINTHHLRGAKEGFMVPVLVIDEWVFCHGQASNGDNPADVTKIIEGLERSKEIWDARIRAFVQGYEKLNMEPKLHETKPHLILYFFEDI
ncbi:MAG: hypothetical protein HGB03_01380 [Candidatus Yonathbacteria bacterium]|nr:hypothetical protein [Candidatus Yonathbacteria bacterium]NTW47916.1 hypothetical protein [Candidatus Yonathbacteria bacterium]